MSADRGVTGRNASRDWIVWHRSYDDPGSSLTRRLDVVRRRIGETLDNAGAAPVRILSLCAGDGRDVLAELAVRPALQASAVLVEQGVRLVERARAQAAELGGVDVRRGDAGDPATFVDVLPVDLLLLCGIFGNVSDDDIRTTVAAVPAMLAAGGIVIWTRGVFDDCDLRPAIRQWFVDARLTEVAFDGHPERFGVGVARSSADTPNAVSLPTRLFTFAT